MPIQLPPHAGQILRCNFSGFVVPEMVKVRPVIVVSPKPRTAYGLCSVVPFSTTEPNKRESHHIEVRLPTELVANAYLQPICWAKCDMINTVSYKRLDLYRIGREADGRRKYSYFRVDNAMLETIRSEVRRCITGKH